MKIKKKKGNMIRRVLLILVLLIVAILVLIKANNYLREKENEEVNLVINNNNVTSRLKEKVLIENGIIYISMSDVKNFFDKYIYIEDEINEIVTTYDKKIASIGFDVNKLTINGAIKKINASAKKVDDEKVYLPISEMTDVYNIEKKKAE